MRRLGDFTRRENHHSLARQESLMDFIHSLFRVIIVDTNHAQAL